MRLFFWLLVLLIALLTGPRIFTNWHTDRQIQGQIDVSVDRLNAAGHIDANRFGHVEVDGVVWVFTTRDIDRILAKDIDPPSRVCLWDWGGVSDATATALGIDTRHHFVNSYLVGYEPFETDRIWVPLYTLVLRKHYEFDHIQYSGLDDVWQNSKQAYYYTRGDCEDHAIILADWLISMGIDARVVIGTHKKTGHAWVIFFADGKEYLLEPTSKRKTRTTGAIPPASLMVDYHPACQFNRDRFWVNTGSLFTTRYSGPNWKMKSRFAAENQGPTQK
jgi:hypothetical protein